MSLPNYVVNLDEMANAIRDAFDSTKLMNLGQQRVYGIQIEVDNNLKKTASWITPRDIIVTGIRFGVNDYRNIGYEDSFNMYVGNELIFEEIRIKEMYEYKRYRQPHVLPTNTEIKFEFNNRDNMKKYVWFDIEYVDKEIEAKTIKIVCIDITTGQEIEVIQNFVKPPHETIINAPTLDGYTVIGETQKTIKIESYSPNITEIKFEYEPTPPPVDPDIDHEYDWKIILRWQNSCRTDLDLHGYFSDGSRVYYGEREIGNGNNKAWLDFDYTSHDGNNDKEDKPEIITILGAVSESVRIKVNGFSRTSDMNEDATVEIQKVENNKLTTLKTYRIPKELLDGDREVTICDIDLISKQIIDKL